MMINLLTSLADSFINLQMVFNNIKNIKKKISHVSDALIYLNTHKHPKYGNKYLRAPAE